MTIQNILNFGKKMAANFRGKPAAFFAELKKSTNSSEAVGMMERQFERHKNGVGSTGESMTSIFETIAPGSAGSEKPEDTHASHEALLLECITAEQAKGGDSSNRPETAPTADGVAKLKAYLAGLKGDAPLASAKPTVTQKPVAKVPTAESIGKSVVALATSPDPKVSGPIQQGLKQSIAAATRPDFSFLTGLQRTQIAAEYDQLGGLTAQNHGMYMLRRKQYCEQYRMTPEQATGTPHAVLPELILDADVNKRASMVKAEKSLPVLADRLFKVNCSIVNRAQESNGHIPACLVEDRKKILNEMNSIETLLNKPLTA